MTQKDSAASIQGLIDANLKRAFGGSVRDDLPDRFADVLRRLEANGQDRPGPGPGNGTTPDGDGGDDA